jgi:hypoxanthine phosphoribosyltransferase
MRRELLTWNDIDSLIDHLTPQFQEAYDAMLMITRGGVVPGGLIAEALGLNLILTAAVDFPDVMQINQKPDLQRLIAWPKFVQFPDNSLLSGKNVLIVDDVWGSGRTITAVKNRVSGAGGTPFTSVLHFNPYRNLFGPVRPDYFAAVTDAYIIYPWEIDRGPEGSLLLGEI